MPTVRRRARRPTSAVSRRCARRRRRRRPPRLDGRRTSTSSTSRGPGAFLVKLPGAAQARHDAWLIVGDHSLHVEAFFCRRPDENHAEFYRCLLEQNGGMYGVHFALDQVGDVYLVGRLPLTSITARRSTGCSAACSRTPTRTSTGCSSSASRPRSGGSGTGGSSAASRLANLRRSRRFADPADGAAAGRRFGWPAPDRLRPPCDVHLGAAAPRRERVEREGPVHRLGGRRPVGQGRGRGGARAASCWSRPALRPDVRAHLAC